MWDSVVDSRADDYLGADRCGAPRVEVSRHAQHTTVVKLTGEHDMSTKARLLDALALAARTPFAVIDLSDCTFVDSSFIAAVAGFRSVQTCRLAVVVPESQPAVRRILEKVRIHEFVTVLSTLEQGLRVAAESIEAEAAPPEA